MLVVLVFVVAFLFLCGVTIIVPSIPPGQLICNLLGDSETDYLIAGISGELLVSAVINGIVWGAVIMMVYSYWRGPAKGKVDLPVWVPGYTTSRSSTIEHKQDNEASFRKVNQSRDIEAIVGIGYNYGRKLRKLSIRTVDDLIDVGATSTGRNYLAKKIGVTPLTIRNWVHQAEAHR